MRQPLTVEVTQPGCVVTASGRLDSSSCDQLRTALHEALGQGEGDLVLRAEGLEIWGSTALGVLIGASRAARRRDRRLVIGGLAPRELRLVKATQLQRSLALEPVPEVDLGSAPRDVQPA